MSTKADELKKIFVTGAVPKEKHFQELIELADESRQILGLENGKGREETLRGLDNTSDKLALKVSDGLAIADNKLTVDVKGKSGIDVRPDGLSLLVNENASGLKLEENGLSVNRGDGLSKTGAVSINTTQGLKADSDGVSLNLAANSGLDTTSNGLKIKLEETETNYLTLSSKGLALSEAGINLIKEGGNKAFIKTISDAQTAVKSSDKNATQPVFSSLATTPQTTDKATDWKTDITNSFEAIAKANNIDAIYASAKEFIASEFKSQETKPAIINISQTETAMPSFEDVYLYNLHAGGNNEGKIVGEKMQREELVVYKYDHGKWEEPQSKSDINLAAWSVGYYLVVGKINSNCSASSAGKFRTANALLMVIKTNMFEKFVTAVVIDMPKKPDKAFSSEFMRGADPVQYSKLSNAQLILEKMKRKIAGDALMYESLKTGEKEGTYTFHTDDIGLTATMEISHVKFYSEKVRIKMEVNLQQKEYNYNDILFMDVTEPQVNVRTLSPKKSLESIKYEEVLAGKIELIIDQTKLDPPRNNFVRFDKEHKGKSQTVIDYDRSYPLKPDQLNHGTARLPLLIEITSVVKGSVRLLKNRYDYKDYNQEFRITKRAMIWEESSS